MLKVSVSAKRARGRKRARPPCREIEMKAVDGKSAAQRDSRRGRGAVCEVADESREGNVERASRKQRFREAYRLFTE